MNFCMYLQRNSRLRSTALSDGRRTPYSLRHRRSVPNAFIAIDEPVKVTSVVL
jgi:hypothetical protein